MSFKLGNQGEDLLISFFNKLGLECTKASERSHDLILKYTSDILVEVKNDVYSRRSGNIALEFYNTKQCKPSGIAASQSHLWCHIHYNNQNTYISFCPTKLLKEWFEREVAKKIISCGGDDNSSMKLYSQDLLSQHFFTIKTTDIVSLQDIEGVLKICKLD